MIKKMIIVIALCVCTVLPVNVKANVGAAMPVDVYVKNQNSNELVLGWSASPYVDGYEIWRATSMSGEFKKIATIDNNMVNEWHGKNPKQRTFRYKVHAYVKHNNATFFGNFGKELIVSTRTLEMQTLGKYIESHNGINYHFYNLGQRKGYSVSMNYYYGCYRVMMTSFKSTKKGLNYTSTSKYTLAIEQGWE